MSAAHKSNLVESLSARRREPKPEPMTLLDYLELCKTDKGAYATAAEQMLRAIGEPEYLDTRFDQRLSRIFANKELKVYPAFKDDFFGMEDAIERIVSYFKKSSQGFEEGKQVLYLHGPVGGGKSSLAEKLKALLTTQSFYAVKGSPTHEDPLGLLLTGNVTENEETKARLEAEYGIPRARLANLIPTPWALKRLEEYEGDLTQFEIEKLGYDQLRQVGITKVEPGDENNQDISALVGKIDIRKLESYAQDDADAYSYSGGLCIGSRGMLEFVEMFKAPIKVLHPLLTATQEKNFKGTEGGAAMPFGGIVMAHSNDSEWEAFKNNKNNEAFLDRIYTVGVPYCLRVTEEERIYKKLLNSSVLASAPCTPNTLKYLAQFAVLTRLEEPENSSLYSKMRVYDGENLKDKDPKAKSLQEYRDYAGKQEGMTGFSTRSAFKVLSDVFNYDRHEPGANPVHLFHVLEDLVDKEYSGETRDRYQGFIKEYLRPVFNKALDNDIREAFLESSDEYCQNYYDRYVLFADHWIQDQDFRDPDTGMIYDRAKLNEELEKIEKPGGVANPKDFRNEVINFYFRYRSANEGRTPQWKDHHKMADVLKMKVKINTEEMTKILSFDAKVSESELATRNNFVSRMGEKGYTPKQTRLMTAYHSGLQIAH